VSDQSRDGVSEYKLDPERLELAKHLAQVPFAADLASRVGRTPGTVLNWEQGRTNPPLSTLTRLADELQTDVRFLTDSRPVPELQDAFFRQPRRNAGWALERFGAYARLFARFVEHLGTHEWSAELERIRRHNAGNAPTVAAMNTRDGLGLPRTSPIKDTVQVARDLGIVVGYGPVASAGLSAFSARAGRLPLVVLNPAGGDHLRQRFSVLHEVGHLVMHGADDGMTLGEREKEAHRFAAAMLYPPTNANMGALAAAVADASFDSLIEISRAWRISVEALVELACAELRGSARTSAFERRKSLADRPGAIQSHYSAPERVTEIPDALDALEQGRARVGYLAHEAGLPRRYVAIMAASTAHDAASADSSA